MDVAEKIRVCRRAFRRGLAPAAVVALTAVASGCMWSRVRMNDPEIIVRARAIVPGKTNVSELPRLLNAQPTRKRTAGKTTTLEYSYSDVKTKALTLIIFNWSRTENVTETLYVDVNAETGLVTALPQLSHHEPEWRFWPFDDGK